MMNNSSIQAKKATVSLRTQDFLRLLQELRADDQKMWTALIKEFRREILPWIIKQVHALPPFITKEEFAEEVLSNSLIKFYELFLVGSFDSFSELRGLMYKVTSFKIKEGFNKIQKDRLIFLEENLENLQLLSNESRVHREMVDTLKFCFRQLPPFDKIILGRYANGELLSDIARSLDIKQDVCRKRKQRALQRLKKLMQEFI